MALSAFADVHEGIDDVSKGGERLVDVPSLMGPTTSTSVKPVVNV